MENYKTKVYIKTNQDGHITAIDAGWNIDDKTDWIYIDEGYGDKYYHAQGNYFSDPIINMQGSHNYKYADGEILKCTEAEKEAQLNQRGKPLKMQSVRTLWGCLHKK